MKNPILIETAYINQLLEDTSIELIEVWSNILYARMKKGCGKNKFISKKGLTFTLPVYYDESNYRKISLRYHPDRNITGSVSKQRTYENLSKLINISRETLSRLFKGRRFNAINFVRSNEAFTRFTTTKSNKERNRSLEQIDSEICKTGHDDYQLFGEYCRNPFNGLVAHGEEDEGRDQIGNEEEILQEVMRVWVKSSKRDASNRRSQQWDIINKCTTKLERIETYLYFRENRLEFWDPIRLQYEEIYDSFRQRYLKSL